MPRVVRMLAHVETDLPRADITHVYLHGAAALRTRPHPGPVDARRGHAELDRAGRGRRRRAARHLDRAGLRRAGLEVLLTDAHADHAAHGLRPWAPAGRATPATGRSSSSSRCRPTTSVTVIRDALDRPPTPSSPTSAASRRGRWPSWPGHRRGWRATSAATRWPAASGPGRWRPARRCSTAGRGRSPRTRRRTPARSRWSRRWSGSCGAVPVRLTPVEHDRAVARTSHVPHLLAALVAGRLADAPADHLALSGQGVRDVTRVAAGDPALYGTDRGRQLRGGARRCSPRSATGSTP